MNDKSDETMQARCVVDALDRYLATFPWPAPMAHNNSTIAGSDPRDFLVKTLAATIRMSEPRVSDLQKP